MLHVLILQGLRLQLFYLHDFLDRKINNTIENFTRDLSDRNKAVVPDIGEFLIQIALSRKYNINEIKNYVYEEYFARQIYWIQRSNIVPNLLDIQIKHLPDIFQSVKVSNHLLVFNLEMAQTFIFPGAKEFVYFYLLTLSHVFVLDI